MTLLEILVIIGCVLIVLGVIIKTIIDRKNGKTSCGCSCSNCSKCTRCNKSKKDHTNK